jgi:hypothetical protein
VHFCHRPLAVMLGDWLLRFTVGKAIMLERSDSSVISR